MATEDGGAAGGDEGSFLAGYDPHAFAPVAVTVDVAALTIRPGTAGRGREPHVLLVRRGEHPQRGRWALPGGFVRAEDTPQGPADDDLPDAALRVLSEKTLLPGPLHLEQLATYGARGRDPRMRVVSVAYLLMAPDLPEPHRGRGIEEAAWVPLRELGHGIGGRSRHALAFDHDRVLADAVERARSKLEYTSLATAFLPPVFTITELRGVYESVWGRELHAANFHRKILATPGFVEDTGELAERGGTGGGRRPRLYRAGGAATLHPPLLRSTQ
ncbi:NUDIX hydrolase [Nocardiopsis algeriensis]|uniref:8-oxo-dGTP diphosphatase n=1 Tax=Nocardiopsis algeriensis TaxID=1478215 RepID=A0A841IZC6_9ACTN|nr:NUDIX domain-containing protein [Nocardiopsis algeriensis]MBB6121491.1 8-oxo-dGTP diphosphatase [Nocardiopsis algeriensis]